LLLEHTFLTLHVKLVTQKMKEKKLRRANFS
jgi:hypothetical protein